MIWLTWRQFRGQLRTTLGALLVLAVALVVLGLVMRHDYGATVADCARTDSCVRAQNDFAGRFANPVELFDLLLLATPALIGAFWGAPLVARELETGSSRLVWTQSISRTRWLATKMALLSLVSAAVTGAFSMLLTWATRSWDSPRGGRFSALDYPARNLIPLGYAVFAFALGVTLGLVLRRTLPAMALTLAVFAGLQVLMAGVVRPHLLPAVDLRVPVNASSLQKVSGLYEQGTSLPDGELAPGAKVFVEGYDLPSAWVLSSASQLLTSLGRPANLAAAQACMADTGAGPAAQGPRPSDSGACLSKLNLHFDVRYLPADRYWPLQGLETAVLLGLAGGLAVVCFRVVHRDVA